MQHQLQHKHKHKHHSTFINDTEIAEVRHMFVDFFFVIICYSFLFFFFAIHSKNFNVNFHSKSSSNGNDYTQITSTHNQLIVAFVYHNNGATSNAKYSLWTLNAILAFVKSNKTTIIILKLMKKKKRKTKCSTNTLKVFAAAAAAAEAQIQFQLEEEVKGNKLLLRSFWEREKKMEW